MRRIQVWAELCLALLFVLGGLDIGSAKVVSASVVLPRPCADCDGVDSRVPASSAPASPASPQPADYPAEPPVNPAQAYDPVPYVDVAAAPYLTYETASDLFSELTNWFARNAGKEDTDDWILANKRSSAVNARLKYLAWLEATTRPTATLEPTAAANYSASPEPTSVGPAHHNCAALRELLRDYQAELNDLYHKSEKNQEDWTRIEYLKDRIRELREEISQNCN